MHSRVPRRLILIRHAESIWNKENMYAGWFNTDLFIFGFDLGLWCV